MSFDLHLIFDLQMGRQMESAVLRIDFNETSNRIVYGNNDDSNDAWMKKSI